MVENRRYSQFELTYVLSRILANWKPEVIARAFKRDHAPYWDDKVFTKKQVSYIKNAYRGPPGSVQPYTGPVPVFTPSPPRSLNRKTDLRLKMYRDGDKSRAQSEAPKLEDSWTDFSSMVSTAVDNQGQQETIQELTEEEMSEYFDFDRHYNEFTAATGFMTEAGASDTFGGGQMYSLDDEPFDYNEFIELVPQPETLHVQEIQKSQLPPRDAQNDDLPLPSVEEIQSDRPQDDATRNSSVCSTALEFNFNDSPLETSSFELDNNKKCGNDNGTVQLPDGFTDHNFVALDDYGWKYSGAHDTCDIACAHRHEGDGGIFFTDYETLISWVRGCQHGGDVLPQNNNGVTSCAATFGGGAASQDSLLSTPHILNAPVVDINQERPVPLVPKQSKVLAPPAAMNNLQQRLGTPFQAQDPVLAAPAGHAGTMYQCNSCAAPYKGGLLQHNPGLAGAYGQQNLPGQKAIISPHKYGVARFERTPFSPNVLPTADPSRSQPDWWATDVWNTAAGAGDGGDNIDPQLIAQQMAWQDRNSVRQAQGTKEAAAAAAAGMTHGVGAVNQQGAAGAPRHKNTTCINNKTGGGTKKLSSSSSPPPFSYGGDGSGNGGRRRRRRAVDSGDEDFDFHNPAV